MAQQPEAATLDSKIIEALKARPGQKAADLARSLGVDRSQVNSMLYGALRGRCVQDAQYRWTLVEQAATGTDPQQPEIPNTPLGRLCRYYLACVGHDDEGGVSVFAKDNFNNHDYADVGFLPGSDSTNVFHSEGAQRLIGKMRQDRSRLAMYFGFPVAMAKRTSRRSNWVGYMVEPIVLYPVEFDTGPGPRIASTFPLINLAALRRLTNAQRDAVMDELNQLEEELGLTAETELPEMDELLRRLADIRPEWPWKGEPAPDALAGDVPIQELEEEAIFNRAVLVVAQRSPYTQGLETELKQLSQLSEEKYAGTALGQWINNAFPPSSPAATETLIEVLPLNLEQRQAIDKALTNPLTIITGPPGTGKSQVVGNLLINAAWQKKRVLFASKNNKAVDVVEIRLNNLGPRPIVLRVGANLYQAKLAEYLISLLAATTGPDDQAEFDEALQRHRALEGRLSALAKEETAIMDLRNVVDGLEQHAEEARKVLGHKVFASLRGLDLNRARADGELFSVAVARAQRGERPFVERLFWRFIREERFGRARSVASALHWLWAALGTQSPAGTLNDETVEEWSQFESIFQQRLALAAKVVAYFSALLKLQDARSLEVVAHERTDLGREMSRNAEALWNAWLKLQPTRLTREDRQLLTRYNAVLNMVIDAGADGALESQVRRQYYELFPKVGHLLPCWAVTSLSAKGRIPFEAGFFDLVVFDEASQCDIASALPLLYRAKAAVVIGDPQQLSHISGIKKVQDQQLLAKYELLAEYPHWAYSYTSLFNLACGFVSAESMVTLRDHHRSHADIIQFSNDYFYEGGLRVATPYDRLKRPDPKAPGVRWVQVSGDVFRPAAGGAVNETEAQAVVGELRQLLVTRGYEGSVGVVSPFREQANRIRDLAFRDATLAPRLQQAEFLAETVHKFQGDERDVMIFSPVVSRNSPPGAIIFLKKNGNLFNVAITRARAMLVVIGDRLAAARSDVEYLSAFAKYVQEIESVSDLANDEATVTHGPEYPVVPNPEQVSDWEQILYRKLYSAGIRTMPQYSVEKYRLDLAIVDGVRRLDIEVDGERYHRNWTGELCRRDQIRNQRMYELGWDVLRFWVYEIRDDMDGCVHRVKQWKERQDA